MKSKKHLFLMIIFLIIFLSCGPITESCAPLPCTSTFIEDCELEKAIRRQLWITSGEITVDDMLSLETLGGYGMQSLKGLEYAINLRWLSAVNGNIKDISPLTELANLYMINFDDNDIEDINPLSKLINLSEIHLSNNNIKNITPFLEIDNNGGFTEKTTIDISYNAMDIRPETENYNVIQTLKQNHSNISINYVGNILE